MGRGLFRGRMTIRSQRLADEPQEEHNRIHKRHYFLAGGKSLSCAP
jgi:hypothetical protein